MNITSVTGILWVALGFVGQALFMGRMLVQWWASEKVKSAVVPPAFWWLSLIGSSMLMTYFIWRVEIVGFLGQSTGWLIYIRNLWFIYGGQKPAEP
ncbi:MAG: lipid-A-disaccharide synthase N-terminal domain-containing protein [Verrucomicrobiae bacterium]|nr:lipid-A-disaccharide synthase N-terminal domain-containing protein [Verrucomicrobiae bacterium]